MKYEPYRGSRPKRGLQAFLPDFRKGELRAFLNHQLAQCEEAENEGDEDLRWLLLRSSTTRAQQAVQAADPSAIAQTFYDVGKAVEAFAHPAPTEYADWLSEYEDLLVAKHKRNAPNRRKQKAKTIAQALAQQLWKEDDAKTIRIRDMCEQVYKIMLRIGFDEHLPGQSEGLATWIRPIAPDHAKRPGRPKKNPRIVR
ncbi:MULTISPECIES: hypothetical protein [unclassified Thioalkalivibrio]|uniref:hypothetical protein n=1 Tax=unclassified Thioalkalivibrio TaxID=2621013 RepID=UPI000380B61F|nr:MULTISPECIES: hypothetical protein [unclassified Thioalkalivibrio]